jgi:4'-phosphopantetheinyl transferase
VLEPVLITVALARPGELDDADAILDDDDRDHVERFRFERDREIARTSRALQRLALSARVPDVDPEDWRFVADERGRPHVVDPPQPGLRFSASNARGLVGCAVAIDREVGLDLEPLRDDAPPELIETCFTPEERAGLLALAPELQPRRFVELWVLKEAYLKARGLGIADEIPLDAIPMIRRGTTASIEDAIGRWQLAFWPEAEHLVALCYQESAVPCTSEVRWFR